MADLQTVLRAHTRVHEAFRTRHVADPALPGRRLSARQASILAQLDRTDPTMMSELAEHFGVTPSTMSLNLKRLEAAGFAARERDQQDRRVVNVRLTEAGERIVGAASPLDPQRVDGVLRELGPAERATALRGLALLAEAADAFMRRGRVHLDALVGDGEG